MGYFILFILNKNTLTLILTIIHFFHKIYINIIKSLFVFLFTAKITKILNNIRLIKIIITIMFINVNIFV